VAASVVIDAYRATDLASVLAIEVAAFGGESGKAPASSRLDEARIVEELARPWTRFWVARRGASVVSFLLAWHVADELHVLDVATHPNARREGLAMRLLDHALSYARAQQIRHLLLEVRRSNVPAIRLYRKLGFFAMGVRPRYYPDDEDAVEMALVLDPQTGAIVPKTDEVKLGA
jgi:ribosomal-protein-alanine N-acetyltransferase